MTDQNTNNRRVGNTVAGTIGQGNEASALSTNSVLRNTYMLLSMTLVWSAFMAGLAMFIGVPPMTYLICVIAGMVTAMFILPKTANSGAGIITVFAVTGLLGFGIGPLLSMYLALSNGPQIIGTALGGTGAIFLALSAMSSPRGRTSASWAGS